MNVSSSLMATVWAIVHNTCAYNAQDPETRCDIYVP